MAHLVNGFKTTSRPYKLRVDSNGHWHRRYITKAQERHQKGAQRLIKQLKPLQTALINQMDFRKMTFETDPKSKLNIPHYVNDMPVFKTKLKVHAIGQHIFKEHHKISRGTLLDMVDDVINAVKK